MILELIYRDGSEETIEADGFNVMSNKIMTNTGERIAFQDSRENEWVRDVPEGARASRLILICRFKAD